MKYQVVRGTKDLHSIDAKLFCYLENSSRDILESFGYDYIRTPAFERAEVFMRSLGDSSDIVSKEMYIFKDKGDRTLALKPEGTAPVIRAALENNLINQNAVTKLYYMDSMFRYERPQKGRYRQFYQIGAEAFGTTDPILDMEIMSIPVNIFKKLGINDFELNINNVGCSKCRDKYIEYLKKALKSKESNLCKNCLKRIDSNVLRVFDCKNVSCKKELKDLSKITDYLCDDCNKDFDELKHLLNKNKVDYIENKDLVRGLDYYTGSVFEIKTNLLGAQDALAAGGRYNNLVKDLGGSNVPATGFALGEERVVELLKTNIDKKVIQNKNIFIVFMKREYSLNNFDLINNLRDLSFTVNFDYLFRNVKVQMKYASNSGADYVLIIGEDEVKNNTVVFKDMHMRNQQTIKTKGLMDFIKSNCL